MATLYLDRKDLELRHEGRHLILFEGGSRRGTVPLLQIDRIVMRGRATISTGALGLLAEAGVALLVLSGRQGRSAAILQGRLHGDAQRRIAQYGWYAHEAERVAWARRLVALKLRAQVGFLGKLAQARTDQAPAPVEVGPDALRASAEVARARIGVNATGLPFNSVMAIELNGDRTMNPMVNAGAIATTSCVPGATAEEKFRFIQEGLSRFAGRRLEVDEEVYESEAATNLRNLYIFGRDGEVWKVVGFRPLS
jgi:hypothetical protein